jgi:hypothetical protein
VPTYTRLPRFDRDYAALTPEQRTAFKAAVKKLVEDVEARRRFRAGLRVKRVQGASAIFELTWAPDGRATFEFGPPRRDDELHVIWRRVGTHDIFKEL